MKPTIILCFAICFLWATASEAQDALVECDSLKQELRAMTSFGKGKTSIAFRNINHNLAVRNELLECLWLLEDSVQFREVFKKAEEEILLGKRAYAKSYRDEDKGEFTYRLGWIMLWDLENNSHGKQWFQKAKKLGYEAADLDSLVASEEKPIQKGYQRVVEEPVETPIEIDVQPLSQPNPLSDKEHKKKKKAYHKAKKKTKSEGAYRREARNYRYNQWVKLEKSECKCRTHLDSVYDHEVLIDSTQWVYAKTEYRVGYPETHFEQKYLEEGKVSQEENREKYYCFLRKGPFSDWDRWVAVPSIIEGKHYYQSGALKDEYYERKRSYHKNAGYFESGQVMYKSRRGYLFEKRTVYDPSGKLVSKTKSRAFSGNVIRQKEIELDANNERLSVVKQNKRRKLTVTYKDGKVVNRSRKKVNR